MSRVVRNLIYFLGHYFRARRENRSAARKQAATVAWRLATRNFKGDPERYALVERFRITGKADETLQKDLETML